LDPCADLRYSELSLWMMVTFLLFFHAKFMDDGCVCVCVCERERDREGESFIRNHPQRGVPLSDFFTSYQVSPRIQMRSPKN